MMLNLKGAGEALFLGGVQGEQHDGLKGVNPTKTPRI